MITYLTFCIGAIVVIHTDSDKTVQSIYFQTKEMVRTFRAYPELLLIDATYKLNDLQMPLYVLMVVDGNGESEIICLWLTQCEDKVTLGVLVDEFKKHNENWEFVRCIMSDKDITERDVLTERLPNAKLLICLFHTLRNMRHEISTDKLGISQAERIMCLEVLSKMAYSKDGDEYNLLHDQLKQCAPKPVLEYFQKNWHGIREQWVDGLKNSCCNYMNRTNNRVESINQKLKMVISRYSGITQFFQDLMKCLSSLEIERDHRAVEVIAKRSVFDSSNPVLNKYMSLLTPYAFQYLQDQLNYSKKVKFVRDIDEVSCEFLSKKRTVVTKVNDCTCGFVSAMRLPCRHILYMRRCRNISEYDESLCAERWKLQHFIDNQRVFVRDEIEDEPNHEELYSIDVIQDNVAIKTSCRTRTLTEQEKYRKAFKVTQSLAQQISTLGMPDFEEGLLVLDKISSLWSKGKRVDVFQRCEGKLIN